jgi:DNA-binding FrmR family transcriptional regulator
MEEQKCNSQHDHPQKKNASHRIKIIQGHLKCLEKMLERDEYCLDIVHQSRAIQKALKQLDLLLINDHLKSCVVDQIKGGEEERTRLELIKLFSYK